MRQWMSRVLTVVVLVPVMGMVSLDPASAGQCRSVNILVTDPIGGAVHYERKLVDCAPGVKPGARPAAGKGAPSCDVKSAPPATFCSGSNPCYYKPPEVPYALPAPPEPTPGAAWHIRYCLVSGQSGVADWVPLSQWIGQAKQPPSWLDQSVEATGQIRMPSAVLSLSPTTRTLVNLDTWFWAQGLPSNVQVGSSALGLVAYATPDRLEVTPGDGSAMQECPWVTVRPQVPADQPGPCSHGYLRSSLGGSARGPNGAPAYRASARAVWTLRFELYGAPKIIPGAQPELFGPEMTAPVVVAEVQTIVTGTS